MRSDPAYNFVLRMSSKEENFYFQVKCRQCPYKTTDQASLTEHIQTIHVSLGYQCDECGYETKYKSKLERHEKIHATTYLIVM